MAAAEVECDLLFVYGTLMSTAVGALGADKRARLKREGEVLGAALLTGARLHDLGRYPGLVETGRPGEVAHGELIRLRAPAMSLRWLDAYEGLVPGHKRGREYERVLREVLLATPCGRGTLQTAWLYLYRANTSRAPVIVGGRWRAKG